MFILLNRVEEKKMNSTLKFSFESFMELDSPNLFIVWSYSDHLNRYKHCEVCKIYCDYCVGNFKKKMTTRVGEF